MTFDESHEFTHAVPWEGGSSIIFITQSRLLNMKNLQTLFSQNDKKIGESDTFYKINKEYRLTKEQTLDKGTNSW